MFSIKTVIRHFLECQRQFAFCEHCHWCATKFIVGEEHEKRLVHLDPNLITDILSNSSYHQACPMCKNNSVSLTPLEKNEGYRISFGDKDGLEIQFFRLRRSLPIPKHHMYQ
ncbi:MAG: hypothetical protein DLM72_13825 [Candidatus Nitrosopolaris wilkensis]|nr:MAG: hypothetical protein DLM72_13825 [Candidatus Nitrosopolaris wilkensis]